MKIPDSINRHCELNNGYRLIACGVDIDGNVQGFDIVDENGKVIYCLSFGLQKGDSIGEALAIIFDGLTKV